MIIAFNNKIMNSSHELFKELSRKEIITAVDISVIRNRELLNFSVFPTRKN